MTSTCRNLLGMMLMRNKSLSLAAALFGCSLAFCLVASGCSSQQLTPSAQAQPYDTSEGVAATVNGIELGERAVSAYIEGTRDAAGLQEDDAWGEWLIANEYTIDSLRAEVVDYYISEELVRQAAEQNGVTVTDAEIDSYIGQQDDMETNSEEDRYYAKQILLQDKLKEKVVSADPTDQELLSYINLYAEELGADAPEDGYQSLGDVPDDVVGVARESIGTSMLQKHYAEWMTAFKDDAEIDRNPLPEGMPYDIDLEPYAQEAYEALAASSDDASSDDASSDDGGEADGE